MNLDIRMADSGSTGFTRHRVPVHAGPRLVINKKLAVQRRLPGREGAEPRVDTAVQP
jgi:hypothetical protein